MNPPFRYNTRLESTRPWIPVISMFTLIYYLNAIARAIAEDSQIPSLVSCKIHKKSSNTTSDSYKKKLHRIFITIEVSIKIFLFLLQVGCLLIHEFTCIIIYRYSSSSIFCIFKKKICTIIIHQVFIF